MVLSACLAAQCKSGWVGGWVVLSACLAAQCKSGWVGGWVGGWCCCCCQLVLQLSVRVGGWVGGWCCQLVLQLSVRVVSHTMYMYTMLVSSSSQEVKRNVHGMCQVYHFDSDLEAFTYPSPWPQAFPDIAHCKVQ